jgi:hypothetical protein
MVVVLSPVVRHSGLQLQVISLYRRAIRAALAKADGGDSLATARASFRAHQGVDRADFRLIEFLLRQGERKVKLLAGDRVQSARTMQADRASETS